MILKYRAKISGMLIKHGLDDVTTAFNNETNNLEEYIKKTTSTKCFHSFLVGALLTAIIFGGAFYYIKSNDDSSLIARLETIMKGN